jgi:hypothetical protein
MQMIDEKAKHRHYQHVDFTLMQMAPLIKDTTVHLNEFGWLLCPYCGPSNGEYLHQIGYTIYERPSGEDGLTIAIDVADVDSIIHYVSGYNPSSRRQGLAILFDCENCRGFFELTISQHKGNTHTEWRRPSLAQMKKYVSQERLDAYRRDHAITDKLRLCCGSETET